MSAGPKPASGDHQRPPLFARLSAQIPAAQFGRYLFVGLWNTAFGYGTFAVFTAILNPRIPHGYILASLIASFLNITVSFLGYKWFVFKTRGSYLREWARCVAVYSGGIMIGLLLLPVLVMALRRGLGMGAGAPYAAGAILMSLSAIYSFVGHKSFSFRMRG